MDTRLQAHYRAHVVPALTKELEIKNVMQVPRLEKIVLNVSVKEATQNVKLLETAAEELTIIAGQKSQIRRARNSIANFKLRENTPIGARVTLRGRRMWEFLDRLIHISLPRVRDFRGIDPRGFDGRGNYSFGVTEQIIFPEINYDRVTKVTGMNLSFVTSANTDAEGKALLRHLGLPFRQ
jgi:large subunit ribosomal protein L5